MHLEVISDEEGVAVLIKVMVYKMLWKSHTATAPGGYGGGIGFLRRDTTIRRKDGVWTRR